MSDVSPPPLRAFLLYFLRLGTFGFGGPIALAGYMQRDLVEEKRWISKEDYLEGLALAQLAPGPLAAQLAMYLGWVRGGVVGATLVAVAFVLPSFLMVLAIAALYVRWGALPWMTGVFYGVGAAVIAIIVRSVWKLVKLTLARDPLLWAIFAVNALVTASFEAELISVLVASGLLALLVKAPPRFGRSVAAFVPFLVTGVHGAADLPTMGRVFLFFAESGAVVFGSGLAIVPFLHAGVVDRNHWLDDRQFLDAVAVAMITPGPVVITVGFIGYLVAGPAGAALAALGVFLPCWLIVIVLAPWFHRVAGNASIKAFVSGVTSAATGAIAGSAFVIGHRALVDIPAVLVFATVLIILTATKKIPEPILVLAAGAAGLLLKTFAA